MSLSVAAPDGGMLRVVNGSRHFLRLWPDPVFLREEADGAWTALEDTPDDFNLTALEETRADLAERHAPAHPGLVAALLRGRCPSDPRRIPPPLQALHTIQRAITERGRFLSVVPEPMLARVRRFPAEHFRLLRFFSAHPDAAQLADTHPALAFLLATHAFWRADRPPADTEELRAVLRHRRAGILAWLGFAPATESAVRLTGKVTASACRREILAGLRAALGDAERLALLRGLPRLNRGALELIADPALLAQVSPRVLRETAADPGEDWIPWTAEKLRACGLPREGGPTACPPLSSRAQINEAFAGTAMLWDLPEYERLAEKGFSFPPPPFPGDANIQPLRTPRAVIEEGRAQGNCVMKYIPSIAAGRHFLCRVLAPERATLLLRKSNGVWRMESIEAKENRPVSDATRIHAAQWLDGSIP